MRLSSVFIVIFFAAVFFAGCSSDSGVTDPGDGGNGGNGGGEGDTLAPVVSITAPTDGASVSTSLNITGTATDDTEVDTVFFEVRDLCDQILWADHDLSAPYGVTWSAGGAQDGSYRVYMAAVDTAGNRCDWVNVNVRKGTEKAAFPL